jgi:hypothetical protein
MKKFTTLEEDLIKENIEIEKKFGQSYSDALAKIDKIKIALDDFAISQTKESSDWGYVGSLVHINEELDDILEFLGTNFDPDKAISNI